MLMKSSVKNDFGRGTRRHGLVIAVSLAVIWVLSSCSAPPTRPQVSGSDDKISAVAVLDGSSAKTADEVCNTIFDDPTAIEHILALPEEIGPSTSQPSGIGTSGLNCLYFGSHVLLTLHLGEDFYGRTEKAGVGVNGGIHGEIPAGRFYLSLDLDQATATSAAVLSLLYIAAGRLTDTGADTSTAAESSTAST